MAVLSAKVLIWSSGAALLVGAGAAWTIQDWRYGERIADIQIKAQAAYQEALDDKLIIEGLQRQLSNARAEALELRNQEREVVTKYVTNEVIKYVQSPDAGKCKLNDDWVRIHNAAASSSVPDTRDTTGESDDTAE